MYVVELDEGARRRASKNETGTGPCVYVGETGLTPEARFSRHKAGGMLAASIVRRYWVRLRPDLVDRGPFLTRASGAKAEKALGDKLRRRGYVVFGGTGLSPAGRLVRRLDATKDNSPEPLSSE